MRRVGGAMLCVLGIWLIVLADAAGPDVLLAFAPLIALLLALAAGWTPGEASLHRLRLGTRRVSPPPAPFTAPPFVSAVLGPRGALLLAFSIAGRGPPPGWQLPAIRDRGRIRGRQEKRRFLR